MTTVSLPGSLQPLHCILKLNPITQTCRSFKLVFTIAGDFAVLLNAGMTVKQAICFNFLSACTCYIGFIIGEVIGEATDGTQWVLVMTAGMFLYISLVDMVSVLLDITKHCISITTISRHCTSSMGVASATMCCKVSQFRH